MKFLVIKFSAIGDCVMTVPAVVALRRLYPGAKIVWVVEDRCSAVVDTDLVDEKIEIPWQTWKKKRWSLGVLAAQGHILKRLRQERFDFAIDFQGHSKTSLWLWLAKPKTRVSVGATDFFAAWLNKIAPGEMDSMHRVEWNLHSAATLILPKVLTEKCEWSMPKIEAAVNPNKVTISVGAGAEKKVYPHWEEVARRLVELGNAVTFLGGPGESAPNTPGATNLVGQLSLQESMKEIVESAVHLAADTGSGHIAAAYDVPVVSIFGPTDPRLFQPYSKRVTLLKWDNGVWPLPESVVEAALQWIRG